MRWATFGKYMYVEDKEYFYGKITYIPISLVEIAIRTHTFLEMTFIPMKLAKPPKSPRPFHLTLLNASGNQFQSIIITSKMRVNSNLRHLILQSNQYDKISRIR